MGLSNFYRSVRRGMMPKKLLWGLFGMFWAMTVPIPIQAQTPAGCPHPPMQQRLKKHRSTSGETLESIAQKYRLSTATLLRLNPGLSRGTVPSGTTVVVPPMNGQFVKMASGQTLPELARTYGAKPEVVFELNGCQRSPAMVFIPQSLAPSANSQAINPVPAAFRQDRYPLPKVVPIRRPFGFQRNPENNVMDYSSGVDLAASPGTIVSAVAAGTVAFAGAQAPWGSLVVINHAQGRQTRYGYLAKLSVKKGQTIWRGQSLGTVRAGGKGLRFEVRYRSAQGWVAQDPQPYLSAIAPASK
jgi:murein DD-endopeptidase MepM/ murein hydrolase activator NlpD